MTGSAVWAVLPVKGFVNAKKRLKPLLGPGERKAFAMAMFDDVMAACTASRSLSGILVVTSDDEVLHRAERAGGRILREERERGINAALHDGIAALRQVASAVVALPSDLPLITPNALDEVGGLCEAENVIAIARASRDGGTNLLACSPSGLIKPGFGPDSFERHRSLARQAGIDPVAVRGEGWALDVDTPEDVARFLAVLSATFAHRTLMEMGAGARLRPLASCREAGFPTAMPR
ncbi:MAG: 2-phospho-L-lactate guanylyltransferase [Alphaproteobacteria bacterium]